MDYAKALSRINDVTNRGRDCRLNSVIVVYESPITLDWQYRIGYFEEYAEAEIYARMMNDKYAKGYKYTIYINGWKTFGGVE